MKTQWRMTLGMSGAYWQGLDYGALPVVEARIGVLDADRADCFARLRVIESSAVICRNRKA